MKILQIAFTVLIWITVGFILWSIFPMLLKVFSLGRTLHNAWL